jgi:replicative DNA helicase
MKRLLRSVIDFDGQVSPDNLIQNFGKLISANVDWQLPEEQRIYNFCLEYFQARLEMPSSQSVIDYFETVGGTGDIEAVERVKDIAAAPFYIRTTFVHLLSQIRDDQNKHKAIALLTEARDIITKGVEFREGRDKIRKQGLRDGVMHFAQKSLELVQSDYTSRTSGTIRHDGQAMWDEYTNAKSNKDKVWGRFTGINEIDKCCKGAKKGELWVHAAFPGELKTSFACNWAYNLATRYKAHTVYWSLEMPYEQVRRTFYAIHSANLKFQKMGYAPLDYRKIRDGELTAAEEEFYKLVIDDFCNNPNYCEVEIRCPDREVSIQDIRLETELIHRQMEVGLVILDHGLLIEPRKGSGKEYVIQMNSIVRDAKKLALHFNHGEKVPVLMLFQMNRAGKEDADKNEGRYKISALTYANEVEKSADTITTTYLNDDHRTAGTTVFCNLKNRDNPTFAPFTAKVDFAPRRIFNLDIFQGAQGGGMSVEEHRAVMEAMAGL